MLLGVDLFLKQKFMLLISATAMSICRNLSAGLSLAGTLYTLVGCFESRVTL